MSDNATAGSALEHEATESPAVSTPVATTALGDSSDSDSDDASSKQTEWLATTRQRRATAGNRMKAMLANEEPDSDLELLFAEDEDDAGFSDAGDDGDEGMDSDSDEEDGGANAGDDMEGEKELERQAKEKKAAQRKRKATDAIPAKFRKKVRITTEAPAPRPKKKSERASWLPSVADMPTRASARSTTRMSKESLHQQMVEREARRLKQVAQMQKKAAKLEAMKRPPMTQEERLREAEKVEERNSKSLNRWEEAEKIREEERMRKLAALNERRLDGPVITFWSGVREGEGRGVYVSVEEKPVKKKREAKPKKGQEEAKSEVPPDGALGSKEADAGKEKGATQIGEAAQTETSAKSDETDRSAKPKEIAAPAKPEEEQPSAEQSQVAAPVAPVEQPQGAPKVDETNGGESKQPEAAKDASPPVSESKPEDPPAQAPGASTAEAPKEPQPLLTETTTPAPPPPPPPPTTNDTQTTTATPAAPPQEQQDATSTAISAPNPDDPLPFPNDTPAASAQEATQEDAQEGTQPSKPTSTHAQNGIIFQNFNDHALRDKSLQTQILFGQKFPKLPRPPPAPICVITRQHAKYRDPSTGLPFATAGAYQEIRKLIRGEHRWSKGLGAWVGRGEIAARGVPGRFLDKGFKMGGDGKGVGAAGDGTRKEEGKVVKVEEKEGGGDVVMGEAAAV